MLIKDIQVGHLDTNCYIVTDEDTLECVVIDPGDESNSIMDYLEEHKLKCRFIFLTHGHDDHTSACAAVSEETGAPVFINARETEQGIVESHVRVPEGGFHNYSEGDKFQVGGLSFSILDMPGHSPGGVAIICENALFTGDTLFKDSCGRTDFSGGDMGQILSSLKKLYTLSGDYEVYPGHMDSSTLDRESRFNYYMKYSMENIK